MHILIDARLYGLEHRGLGRYLVELIPRLVRSRVNDRFTLLCAPNHAQELGKLGPNVRTIPVSARLYSWREQLVVAYYAWQVRAEVVHVPHFNVPLCIPGPLVVTVHDLILHHAPTERASQLPGPWYRVKLLLYRLTVAVACTRARVLITVSRTVADDINAYYPKAATKVRTVPLAPSTLGEAKQTSVPAHYLITVGAAYPHKNIESVIGALAELRSLIPDLTYVIVGKDDYFMKRLQQKVVYRAIKGVKFLFHTTDAQLAYLYTHALAYVAPSTIEGFGLPGLEAMVYQCPVLANDIPVFREVYQDAAYYYQANTPTDLTKAVRELFFAGSTRQRLVQNMQRVVRGYSWEKVAEQTYKCYCQVSCRD